MKNTKIIINTDSLSETYKHAKAQGKVIESFKCDEVSLVAGGIFEMGAIYDIKYRLDNINPITEPQHIAFLGSELNNK